MMRVFRISMVLLIFVALILILTAPSQARTYAWITIGPPSYPTIENSTFTTDLNLSSWNGIIGALDFTINYDPAVLNIINFTASPDSPFYSNLFIDSESYASGETEVAGFQATEEEVETTIRLGILTWQVVGMLSSATNVSIEPETVVESNWSQIEVLAYGQNILIILLGDVKIDCIINIFDLASVGLAYGSQPGDANWNVNADLTGDGLINIFDLATVGLNYGKICV